MSHARLYHRRYVTREQRMLAIQQAATAASRGYHLSRDMKTLLSNLSPAERRLVATKNNLEVNPGSPVPYRRLRSQSVACPPPSPERIQRNVERTRSLSMSEGPPRHGSLVRQLTEREEEDRFRTYAKQMYIIFAVLAAVVAGVAFYAFVRIRYKIPREGDGPDEET